jgi:hypothetical protein
MMKKAFALCLLAFAIYAPSSALASGVSSEYRWTVNVENPEPVELPTILAGETVDFVTTWKNYGVVKNLHDANTVILYYRPYGLKNLEPDWQTWEISGLTNSLSVNIGVTGTVTTVGSGNYTSGVWTVTDGGGMNPIAATGTYHYVRSITHLAYTYYLRAKIPDDNWVISEIVDPGAGVQYIRLSYSPNYANPILSTP